MRRPALALLALGLLLTPSAFAHDEDPIEAALRNPQATGLLVMGVVPDSQSHASGIAEGDVLLSYDGKATPDVPTLTAAKDAATAAEAAGSATGPVVCVFRRAADGKDVEIPLAPGPLGLQLVPIEKGKPPSPLPADTGAAVRVADAGERDDWFVLSMGGERAGVEHISVRVDGDLLHFRHEVAFHGGTQWGLHHGIVHATMLCGTTVQPVSVSYENGLNGWISDSRVVRDGEGRAVWRATVTPVPGADAVETDMALSGAESSLPSYAVAQVARLLPQEKGACFRFRPVSDWDGKPGLPAAIVCVGAEAVTIDGTEHATWKFEQRQLGGNTLGTYWIDAERRIVQADYGGPIATISTQEKAVAGLHEELKLRTAD